MLIIICYHVRNTAIAVGFIGYVCYDYEASLCIEFRDANIAIV